MKLSLTREVDVYRVGVLYALWADWRRLRLRAGPRWWVPLYLRREVGTLRRLIRQRKWRDVRNRFNGWLAEHAYAGTRAGHGWTRRRALADLRRHLAQLDGPRA